MIPCECTETHRCFNCFGAVSAERDALRAELAKSEMGYRGVSSDRDRLKAELEKVMDQERHEQARLIEERDRFKALAEGCKAILQKISFKYSPRDEVYHCRDLAKKALRSFDAGKGEQNG